MIILSLLAALSMQSAEIKIMDSNIKYNGQFFHQEKAKEPKEKGLPGVMMCYYYDNTPWIDKARTAWIAASGYASNDISYVKYRISNRGVVVVQKPFFLSSRNATAYWLGFTGSREHASSIYGVPVRNIVEVADGETVEIYTTLVSKNGEVSHSTKPFRITRYGGDTINPWYWKSEYNTIIPKPKPKK